MFNEIGCEWEWVNITMQNVSEKINFIKTQRLKTSLVLNLCDGDDINGVPGLSVIYALVANHFIYTGADAAFYKETTSKITMKEAFDRHQVVTPKWTLIDIAYHNEGIFDKVGDWAIVKPAVSAGSMGLSVKNVVNNLSDFRDVVDELKKGYHGWKLDSGGLIAEQFIKGREFTTLLVGSYTLPAHIKFYKPVERVFHPSLVENEQFLSFDRLWETYDDESRMPDGSFLYEYAEVTDTALESALKDISLRAYDAVNGMGYGRLDIRMDKYTHELYMLEVNAQCGLSQDENYTSIGAILRFSGKTFTDLIIEILEDAISRK